MLKDPPPAGAVLGERLVILNPAVVIVNGRALVTTVPVWPAFCAVTDTGTGCAMRLAGTAAVPLVALVMVVASAVLFQ